MLDDADDIAHEQSQVGCAMTQLKILRCYTTENTKDLKAFGI